jgi:hypothetical protein
MCLLPNGIVLILSWGQGHVCYFLEGAEHPVWYHQGTLDFVKSHGLPGPEG